MLEDIDPKHTPWVLLPQAYAKLNHVILSEGGRIQLSAIISNGDKYANLGHNCSIFTKTQVQLH